MALPLIVPPEFRGFTPQQLYEHLDQLYWRNTIPICGTNSKRTVEGHLCLNNYWNQRIARDFANFIGYEQPPYPNGFDNYLAIRVQRDVAEIFAQADLIRVNEEVNPALAQEHRVRFDEYVQDSISASLVLGSALFATCRDCHSVNIVIEQPDQDHFNRLLLSLNGTYSINSSERGLRFQQEFVANRYGMTNGSMVSFHFARVPRSRVVDGVLQQEPGDWPDFVAFMDRGLVTVSGPYIFTDLNASRELPVHFSRYLRRVGIVSVVAVHLYPVLAHLVLSSEFAWI